MRLFLSYRRDDSAAHAGRLRDALADRFGADAVFQDVVTIGAGEDFTVAVDRALDASDALLVVMGPGWVGAKDPEGRPRLHDEHDYVRFEVARALERDLRIIPVLVGGAAIPAPRDLPAELRPLVNRQAVHLDDATWHHDVEGLLRSLGVEPAAAGRFPRWARVAGAVALAAVAALVAVLVSGGGTGGSSATTGAAGPPLCPPTDGPGWTGIAVLDPAPSVQSGDGNEGLRFAVTDGAYRDNADGTWDVVLTTAMSVLSPSPSGETAAYHSDWRYDALAVDGIDFGVSCFRTIDAEVVTLDRTGRARVGFTVTVEPSGWLALTIGGASVDVTAG